MAQRTHGAFILARYSTDQQNPDSIEVQVNKCTEWCNNNGLPILGIFADMAVSGMKDTRPQYEMMMQQLRQERADTVVIYDQSRMFRKMTAWFSFRDELTRMGVSVVSVTQPMIGKDLRDPTNFLAEGSMALFNQIWALQTRQKVMEKMRYMANNGQHTGGKPALGYKVENGRLVIHEEEAKIVRRIFREYASGMSYRDIINGLNRDGLKTKRGNPFGSNSLHDMLHNEKYIGVLVYGASPYREDGTRNTHSKDGTNVIRIEDAVPAIVDKETFRRAQERMAQNKSRQGGRPPLKRDYPLKGKVFCGECKAAMTISTSQMVYDYYKCSAKKRKHDCDNTPISVDKLEQTVIEYVRGLFRNSKAVEKVIHIMREQAEQTQSSAVSRLRVLIDEERENERLLENAIDAVLNGLNSPTVKKRITELEAKKDSIAREKRFLRQEVDSTSATEADIRRLFKLYADERLEDTAALLALVGRVEVSKDTITIWTIIDTDPDGEIDFSVSNTVTTTSGDSSGVPQQNHPSLLWLGFLFSERNISHAFCPDSESPENPKYPLSVLRGG